MLVTTGRALPQSPGHLSELPLGRKEMHPFPPIGMVSAGPKFRTIVEILSLEPAGRFYFTLI